MKIYCMSDIHGCLNELEEALSLVLEHINEPDTMLCFLGDYIHGPDGRGVLDRIMSLQDKYGEDKIVALIGNHEDFVFSGYCGIDGYDYEENEEDEKYFNWIRTLPSYYTYGNTIFVHAGIDEEAGEDWEWGTSYEIFTAKYPASIGKIEGLDKKVVAGHVYTSIIADDYHYHDIYYDGKSHYYIDGNTLETGIIPILLVDTDDDKYYQVKDSGNEEVKPYK